MEGGVFREFTRGETTFGMLSGKFGGRAIVQGEEKKICKARRLFHNRRREGKKARTKRQFHASNERDARGHKSSDREN